MKLLSIITVSRNNVSGLMKTYDSVASQYGPRKHEWIVIDGASTDGSQERLASLPGSAVRWISEPDCGTYDAMNKGVKLATGDYLLFLNSGDLLAHSRVVHEIAMFPLRTDQPPVVLGGYRWRGQGGLTVERRPRPPGYLWHSLPTSHQAILYPVGVFEVFSYELKYSICGDYALTCSVWRNDWPFVRVPVIIAEFGRGGVSTSSYAALAAEAALVQRDILRLPSIVISTSRLLREVTTFAARRLDASRHR